MWSCHRAHQQSSHHRPTASKGWYVSVVFLQPAPLNMSFNKLLFHLKTFSSSTRTCCTNYLHHVSLILYQELLFIIFLVLASSVLPFRALWAPLSSQLLSACCQTHGLEVLPVHSSPLSLHWSALAPTQRAFSHTCTATNSTTSSIFIFPN